MKLIDIDKIKAYDEAIRKAKITLDCCGSASIATKNTVYNIFPELKEPEDDSTRKELLAWLKNKQANPSIGFSAMKMKQWIAWLEKQSKETRHKPSKEDDVRRRSTIQVLEYARSLDAYNQYGKADINKNIAWLEKQVHTDGIIEKAKTEKQRVIITETNGNANIDWDTRSLEDAKKLLECGLQYINTELEKQGEQNTQGKSALEAIKEEKVDNRNYVKLADKVEPKFHEGDWVVYKNDICQIVKREEGCNKLVTVFGIEKELVNEQNLSTARLWTIQDAKDGDVLCCESGWTCIFKALHSAISFSSYCFMDKTGWFCETGSESHTLKKEFLEAYNGDIYPATKEQRDTLLKSMADAGYTFDFEKKELKKIEQKPAEWKQENVEELSDFENAMMHIGGSFFGENAGLDPNDTVAIKEQAELLLKLAPKQEWSEEDEKIRKSLLRWIQSNSYTSIAGIQINDVIAWFESLRPQINVTDKELAQARKEAYNEVLDKIEYHDEWPTFDDGWNAAIWYLKKRNGRPQSHCKPNDDQTTSRLS